MKKRWILLLIPVCVLLMFVLFHEPAHPVTVPDNVVAVEMPDYGGTQLYSTSRYTSPEKVQAILDALSAMDPRGDPIDLQLTGGTGLIVVLQTADGEQAIYEVFDGRWGHYFYMGKATTGTPSPAGSATIFMHCWTSWSRTASQSMASPLILPPLQNPRAPRRKSSPTRL